MKCGSVFTGMGGFELAALWMGWTTIFQCEIGEFNQQILKYYWPNATLHKDITSTDFTIYRGQIDILFGGFPCQPFSNSGMQLGEEDERYLAEEMLRVSRETKAKWIVAENVFGITSGKFARVFEHICTSLESEGYEVQPFIIPASAVGAPHERYRVWFVAYSNKLNGDVSGLRTSKVSQQQATGIFENSSSYSDSFGQSRQGWAQESERAKTYADWKASWTYNDGRWPIEPEVCSGNDGLSFRLDGKAISSTKWRSETIKSGGNAIVPHAAFQIFKTIEQIEFSANTLNKQ